jgi:radical SAM superfamily enzyme YgiQ (UPF0313 family)
VREVEEVVDELEYWYDRGKKVFNFVDDNFTFDEDRVYEFCDAVERRNLKGLILRASNGIRADRVDYALLKRMKQVGFRSIGIGVESGSDRVLKSLRKGETVSQIETTIQNACSLGYEVALFFVFGAPGETLEDVEKSIELALKYPVFKVDFYNLLPFPGTQLYEWVNEQDRWLGNRDELLNSSDKSVRFGSNLFFETEQLSAEDLARVKERVRHVMKVVERRYIERALREKMGVLAYPIAFLASTRVVQKLYFNNNCFRKMAETVRYSLLRRNENPLS